MARDGTTGNEGASPAGRSAGDLTEPGQPSAVALDLAPIACLTTSLDGIVLAVNQRAEVMLGASVAQLVGMPAARLVEASARPALAEHLTRALRGTEGEVELLLRAPGRTLPVLLRSTIAAARGAGARPTVVSTLIDISPLKKKEQELRRAHDQLQMLANHDMLTGLPNRNLLLDRLRTTMAEARRSGTVHALLFLDIDRFKVINDSLGHDMGDGLLQHVARCLSEAVRADDTVARMGGDEFTVILHDVINVENAQNAARKILATINRPVSLLGHRVRPSSSIGLCMFNGSESSNRELLRRADQSMYAAKNSGGNTVRVHDPDAATHGFSELERDLHTACDLGQLRLRYQSQYDAEGRVTGSEALLRWRHPTRGTLTPGRFITLAEQSGLICDIGRWVLERACQANVAATPPGTAPRHIAVNASLRELSAGGYAEVVARVLEVTGHPGEALEIEVTETALGLNERLLVRTLEQLRELGCSIALDDFGNGYSSFARLRRLPVTRLKMDRSFVSAIDESDADRRIAAAIVSLGRELGLGVVAEGVETLSQFHFLRDSGCSTFQGYLFSRPARMLV